MNRRYMFTVASLLVVAAMIAGLVGIRGEAATAAPVVMKEGETVTGDMLMNYKKPRLVVVIAVDQLRPDYMMRFADQFLPAMQADGQVGGFRWLMQNAAYFTNAEYNAFPLYTGTGHGTMLTGADPYKSGIIGNDWYSRANNDFFYVVEDQRYKQVGAPSSNKHSGMAPTSLKATTVGDELRASNGQQSKVVALALKDRAAILMGGHIPTQALWFDVTSGNFVSSEYYRPGGQLDAWVQDYNTKHTIDQYFDKTWDRVLPVEQYWRSEADDSSAESKGDLGVTFPHVLKGSSTKPDKNFYNNVTTSPYGNDVLLDLTKQAITNEKLGQRDSVADMLTVSFSTNDYLGHQYGPQSQEVQDMTIRTDRQLADLFNYLNKNVPGGLDNVVISLTADHGVAPAVNYMTQRLHMDAGAQNTSKMAAAVENVFSTTFGADNYLAGDGYVEPNLYLDNAVLAKHNIKAEDAHKLAAETMMQQAGVYAAYTKEQIMGNALPQTDLTRRIMLTYNPELSGDVVVIDKQFWFAWSGNTGTTHGSAYSYDTHVPLAIYGKMIKPGIHNELVKVNDLAPTLSIVLGIAFPSGNDGRVLDEILKLANSLQRQGRIVAPLPFFTNYRWR